jgi:Zn-dependent peptidase ImmA (M78 family)
MIAKLYEGKSISEWAKHYNVSRQRIYQRLKNTGSVHGRQTNGRPNKKYITSGQIIYQGKTLREWSAYYKAGYAAVYRSMRMYGNLDRLAKKYGPRLDKQPNL